MPSTGLRRLAATLLVAAATASPASADVRPRDPMNAAELRLALHRLQIVGSALYVAAHPDDENTAMLSWFARERNLRTGYLSLTRGDGGQNLIGPEFGAELGVLRTQELLAARRVDGAEQWFTRALDFGFSKGPDETLRFWGHDSILADVVWVIRRFRPDVIVTRFPTDGSGGHGHHTASAILAEEAFTAAADPARFPEQLRWVRPWQAKRLFWNAFRPDTSRTDAAWLTVDLGTYNPVLGRSYTEIAAVSRSNHKSQGFGSSERRGSIPNFLAPRLGAHVTKDPFEGLDLTWNRVSGGAKVAALLARAEREYVPGRPGSALPALLEAQAALASLADDPLIEGKRAELREAIRSCAGLWLEAVALRPTAVAGASVRVATSALNRSDIAIRLERIEIGDAAATPSAALGDNRPRGDTLSVSLAPNAPLSQPYWLREPADLGRFRVDSRALIGLPENPPVLTARFHVRIARTPLVYEVPVAYRWTDPVQGERWRPFDVTPPATLELDEAVYAFPDRSPKPVSVTVRSADAALAGRVSLRLPAGWSAEPGVGSVTLGANAESTLRFVVTPGDGPVAATFAASIEVSGRTWGQRLVRIDYPHVPLQTLFPPAEARLVRTDLRHVGEQVGYLMGSGDPVPGALRQMGYQVTLLTDADVENGDLSRFQSIVTGVRAYNTRPRLRALQPRLLDWVRSGGTLVMQYNTADAGLDRLGPLPFRISRDRVTVEEAAVARRLPGAAVLTRPNAIGDDDFRGWVQERGLYFANPWDAGYETPLSCHDPDEPARDGGLLVARHGRGVFVYCAYAMFRQLPAGVPGAWRLFANLVSARP